MLRDRGMWSASLSCWPNTAACSLEQHTKSQPMFYTCCGGLLVREVGGHTTCQTTEREQDAAHAAALKSLQRRHCSAAMRTAYIAARARQTYCLADVLVSCRLHEEAPIIIILTTETWYQYSTRHRYQLAVGTAGAIILLDLLAVLV